MPGILWEHREGPLTLTWWFRQTFCRRWWKLNLNRNKVFRQGASLSRSWEAWKFMVSMWVEWKTTRILELKFGALVEDKAPGVGRNKAMKRLNILEIFKFCITYNWVLLPVIGNGIRWCLKPVRNVFFSPIKSLEVGSPAVPRKLHGVIWVPRFLSLLFSHLQGHLVAQGVC